ncbi:Acetyl esterase/lipase [Streptosporangium subroseum]|uniref:Acetyl esterase/lipase n=1 Tax=Streptosporangium subroseum TaxID=106412 RepID=A0A239GSR5_9ACTN|nr:alpha/beta hydrolase [Streptosporangium subroseum]SNS71543.1 Acetyl esterase/lipase [Streptosporangium subroseum]
MHDEIDVDVCPDYPLSWQAAALSAIMRRTFKPMSGILLRTGIGVMAVSRIAALAGKVPLRLPAHVSVVRDEVGACSGEWVRAGQELDEGKVLLYFHGGGYFACSPATHRPITWRLSAAARRPVLAVDYRQGPVHRLPESLEDAVAAYLCLLERGYAPADILLAGDSAGGHLTLATLLALRDRGLPLPAAAVCLSPWTDLTDVPHQVNSLLDPMISAGRVDWLARRWTVGLDTRHHLVSPVFGDYTGLPPLMIVTGSTEVLRDEGRRVAERARSGGVPVTYEEWPRMPHAFAILADVVPEARRVFLHIARFLSAAQVLAADDPGVRDLATYDPAVQDPDMYGPLGQDLAGEPVAYDPAVQDPAADDPGARSDASAVQDPTARPGSAAA